MLLVYICVCVIWCLTQFSILFIHYHVLVNFIFTNSLYYVSISFYHSSIPSTMNPFYFINHPFPSTRYPFYFINHPFPSTMYPFHITMHPFPSTMHPFHITMHPYYSLCIYYNNTLTITLPSTLCSNDKCWLSFSRNGTCNFSVWWGSN